MTSNAIPSASVPIPRGAGSGYSALTAVLLTAGLLAALPAAAAGNASTASKSAVTRAGANAVPTDRPASVYEASRFLVKASFGPDDFSRELVMKLGYRAWIDNQLSRPATSHRAYWEAANTAIIAANPLATAGQDQVWESFWKQASTGNDQLRQRVVFALSELFVISALDGDVGNQPRAMAAWLDMLGDKGLTTYRDLLEAVALHPMMGVYLDSLRNQKADGNGRLPDLNFGREVVQLFSIGVYKLNQDGTLVLVGGNPVDTYTGADIAGMANVFTGFSWACANTSNSCFFNGNTGGTASVTDPDRHFKPMQAYPAFHGQEEKSFFGVTIPARTGTETAANQLNDLKIALDTLSAHPNTPPFISKQLIQRLVTSNPSPAYVGDVAAVFINNGAGVRGDMKAVIKAILTHPESFTQGNSSGKLREPVLRLSAYLRAFPHSSDTGNWRVGNTDSASTSLSQTPQRAGSVFNFFRPGYVAPNSQTAAAGLVSPEQQLLNETSAAGWVNYIRDSISAGVGQNNGTVNGVVFNRRDLQRDWSFEMALAPRSAELVTHITDRLLYGQASVGMQTEILNTVNRIVIPALAANGSNLAAVNTAKRNRINAAVLLTLASPEFLVQK